MKKGIYLAVVGRGGVGRKWVEKVEDGFVDWVWVWIWRVWIGCGY